MRRKNYSPRGFAERLQESIYQNNYNQTTLANAIGADRKTVMSWCNERTSPDALMLARVSSVLGVSVDWLILRKGGDLMLVTRENAIKILKKQIDGRKIHSCPVCQRDIWPTDEESWEYVKTKSGTDIFVHTNCVRKWGET